jgi:hypothetical protein
MQTRERFERAPRTEAAENLGGGASITTNSRQSGTSRTTNMAAVVASLARNIFQRQRDRLRSDRVDSHDHEEEEEEESDRSIENDDDVITEEEEGSCLNDQQSGSNTNARTQDESESSNTNNEGVQSFVARTTMTLAELEEEVRQRQADQTPCILVSELPHDSLDNYLPFFVFS